MNATVHFADYKKMIKSNKCLLPFTIAVWQTRNHQYQSKWACTWHLYWIFI